MFLFILDSIGTQELVLIAGVALVIFGPRKLPEIVKTIGKVMAQFRNATSEFKNTWEKEVAFEDEERFPERKILSTSENTIAREKEVENTTILTSTTNNTLKPEVKELSSEDAARLFQNNGHQPVESKTEEINTEKSASAKRDWL